MGEIYSLSGSGESVRAEKRAKKEEPRMNTNHQAGMVILLVHLQEHGWRRVSEGYFFRSSAFDVSGKKYSNPLACQKESKATC
jgi:hypothetical protein